MDSEPSTLLSIQGLLLSPRDKNQKTSELIHWSCQTHSSHGIMGPRGSGKSLLAKAMAGLSTPEQGQWYWKGSPIQPQDLRDPKKVQVINLHTRPLPHFSLLENLCFPQPKRSIFRLGRSHPTYARAQIFLAEHFPQHSPEILAQELSETEQLEFSLLKALFQKPELLILDELLPLLSERFKHKAWRWIKQHVQEGLSLIWISHSLRDIDEDSDHISIMKDRQLVLTRPHDRVSRHQLIRLCYEEIEQNPSEEQRNLEDLMFFLENQLARFPIMAIALSHDGKLHYLNHEAKQFFLYSKDHLPPHLKDLLGETNQTLFQKLQLAIQSKSEQSFFTEQFKRKLKKMTQRSDVLNHGETQQTFHLDIRIFPFLQHGDTQGTMITLVDVSEQVQLRQQMLQSEELAGLGLLAAGVAHEINNPLEVLFNDISFLRYKHRDNSELQDSIEHLQEQATHIQEIVSQLVHFSGDGPNSTSSFCTIELLQDLLKFISVQAKDRNIELHTAFHSQHIPWLANRNEIKQVILNIVKNAFEAMEGSGELHITSSSPSPEETLIEFKDSGCGLENPEAVFRPFYSTKKGNGKNMGLGMSIIYGLVKKNGGDIQIENHPQGGCVVRLHIPQSHS